MKIIERIYDELSNQGKSAADLARHLGVTTGQTTAWKQRKTDPPAKYIYKIAEFLNVSVDCLLGVESSTQTETEADFTYAAYNELTHDLTEVQINQLKTYADFLRQQK